jgi:hypothetical protein
MFKNIIIIVLGILVALFWLSEEPDDAVSNDPNDVTIEYQCNELEQYKVVPPEVVDECRSRGFAVKNSI